MITDEERKKLKKVFGHKHIVKIREYFIEKKIHNREEEPYSQTFISRIFNGRDRHDVVENGILEAAIDYKQKIDAKKNAKQKFLADV
ncbi:hypothetical protein [Leeuwenhoekiella marinoflava]|uniref:Uncharacterized protein n=2 Tax=Leeuwenhoekiella marinoflava TaxID=988 RepID=A0A4Q0PNI3_9FLAO|nr:hypothetical protein [Leeuwenhoekiella marinoflava]RXG32013.1 hypothetical protein DSL99_1316 [Leeuwenhoekiella marinoflava]SHE94979.1 hypothetical protein SAMN02745246_01373 [Leeuwenhoekiella marinoflava DSM 3653]